MENMHSHKISTLMKIFLRLTFPAILIFTLTVAHAQESGRIAGLVLDKVSGDPLPGANVFLEGTTIGASSDMNGEYLISKVSPGSYNLVIKYIGYKETSVPINVEPGEKVYQLIELEYVAIIGDIIEITAQAEGQIEAINQQLSSNTISNVVSADRIQDVPDANAAESVGRLPGISIVRSGGEGQKVAIRGMSPQYNVMMINGVRMESTDRDDRSVDLNMIAPNMLSGIEVKKVLTADMDADAVGGTVDLKIGKAREGFYKSFTLQGGFGSLADTYGNYKFSGLVSNRFLDGKLGLQVSGTLDKYDRSSDRLSARYIPNQEAGEEVEIINERIDIWDVVTDRKRKSAGLIADYQFSNGSLLLNNFISNINENSIEQQNRLTISGQIIDGYAEDSEFSNTVIGNALQGEFEFYNINMDFSLSNSIAKQHIPGDLRMTFGSRATTNWDKDSTLEQSVTDADPVSLLNNYHILYDTLVGIQQIYTIERDVDQTGQSAVLNFEVPFNITNQLSGKLKFGGKYIRNTRKMDEDRYGLGIGASDAVNYIGPLFRDTLWTDLGLNERYDFWAGLFEDPDYDIGDFLAGKEGIKGDVFYNKISIWKMNHFEKLAKENLIPYLIDGEQKSYYLYHAQASTQYDYEYTRNFGAGYIMTELNISKYVTLLPGIRYEKYHYNYTADSTSERSGQTRYGFQAYETKTLTWDSTEAETWFPQLQMRIKPTDWLDIRLASTKSIIYPDYRSVSPYIYFTQATSPVRAELGNPYLKPAITKNIDIYTSIYENHIGLFTAGFFYKEIDDLIQRVDYTVGYENASSLVNNRVSSLPASANTRILTWTNLENTAYVRGIELDWQTHFWYLPSYLKGLVLNINYTHTSSDATYPYMTQIRRGFFFFDTTLYRSGRLVDQPDDILNLTFGYDIGDFSARLSFLYQDNIFIEADEEKEVRDRYTAPYYRWDLTAYQKLPWLEGLQLYLNVNNITDVPDREYQGPAKKESNIEYYGRTADMGIRYSF